MSVSICAARSEEFQAESLTVTNFQSLMSYEWPLSFKNGQPIDYTNENTSYALQCGWDESKDETFIQTFMPDPAEPDSCDPQTEELEKFCRGASIRGLSAKEDLPEIALVDQGSFDNHGVWRRRENRGPLTAYQLGYELGRDRFSQRVTNRLAGEIPTYLALSASGDKARACDCEPDAERRLIFVVDLNPDSIYALVSTVSENMAFALRAAISRHLAFETFIAVTFTGKGVDRFRLAFHLPYYALRSSEQGIQDPRLSEQQPLRHTENVSFLGTEGKSYYLYEAQISCVVAGVDDCRWDAYCFVDTYFQSEDENNPESISEYYEETKAEQGMYHDPLTRGKLEAEQPIGDPRQYFLAVFQYRLQQVKNEWQLVIGALNRRMRRYYGQVDQLKVSQSKHHCSLKEAGEHLNDIQQALSFIREARQLSKRLLQYLSNTIDVWEKFSFRHAVTFQDLRNSKDALRPIPVIQEAVEELEAARKTLSQVAMQCEDFARDLELHLNHAAMEVSIHQRQLAQDSKTLSVIMILFISPIALTAAVFSMPLTVLPVLQRNSRSFLALTFVLALLGVAVTCAQSLLLRVWRNFLANLLALGRSPMAFGTAPKLAQSSMVSSVVNSQETGAAATWQGVTLASLTSVSSGPI